MTTIRTARVTETTEQTHTGDTNFSTAAEILGTAFPTGGDYIIFVSAKVNGSNANTLVEARLVHGATPTEFNGSLRTLEPNAAVSPLTDGYGFFTRFTQPATEETIAFQIRTLVSGETVRADDIVIFAMLLDDLDAADFFYNEDDDSGAPTTHTAAFQNFASITFTPDNNNDHWAVFANHTVIMNTLAASMEYRINRDSDTELAPLLRQEAEDTAEQYVDVMHRVYELSNAEHTFTYQGRDDADSGSENDHHSSRIFALRLEAFEDFDWLWTEAPVTPSGIHPTYTELQGLPLFAPTTDPGDFAIFTGAVYDHTSLGSAGYTRIQINGTTDPAGSDAVDKTLTTLNDSSDEAPMFGMTVANLTGAGRNLDMDGSSNSFSATVEDRSFWYFSLELAGVEAAPDLLGAPAMHGASVIMGRGGAIPG